MYVCICMQCIIAYYFIYTIVPEDERPGFVIYPFSTTFTTQMKQSVAKLQEALKKLNGQTDTEKVGGGEPNVALPGDHANVPAFQDDTEAAAVSSTMEAFDFD